MNYWNKNLQLLKKYHPYLLPLKEPLSNSKKYAIKYSRSGCPVPVVLSNPRNASLHSLYYPEKESMEIPYFSFPLILGMGGLYHFQDLLDQARAAVVIEPQKDFFLFLLQSMDLSTLLMQSSVRIYCGDSPEQWLQFMDHYYSPYTMGMLDFKFLRTAQRLFPEIYGAWIEKAQHLISRWETELSTQEKLSRNWFRNSIGNIQRFQGNHRIPMKENIHIIAAGPGVEKELQKLNAEHSDSTILAVDSVLPLLMENKILPDIVFTLDSQIVSYHHYLKGIPQEALSLMDISAHRCISSKRQLPFYTSNANPLLQYLIPELTVLNTGLGNVTALAIDFAILAGFKRIEVSGADFSFPSGKAYSRGTYLVHHYQYVQNRLNSLEDQMYSFSLKGRIQLEKGLYSTTKMLNYRKQLESWMTSNKNLLWERHEPGNYLIKNINLPVIFSQPHIKDLLERLEKYRMKLSQLPLYDHFSDYPEELRPVISTLFPLMSSYLKKHSWKESLALSRDWALDQCNGLIKPDATVTDKG